MHADQALLSDRAMHPLLGACSRSLQRLRPLFTPQLHHASLGRLEVWRVHSLSTNGTSPVFYPTAWPPLPRLKSDVTFPPAPPPPCDEHPAWSDEVWASPLDVKRQVFCNRSLNMSTIKAVGFDMDYTLAQYRPETFETLAHTQTVQKLVEVFGYPQVLYDFKFDWRYMVRGLTIDKHRGNVLKIDRHKYVKIAYHGFRQLSRDKRLTTYSNSEVRFSFDEPEYAMIDTLFSLAEAHLFMQLVELQDQRPHALPAGKSYADMYRDVRAAVDLCHRDGSLKQAVAADPGKYIHEDRRLAPLLDMYRQSGFKLFLATNSLWDYTNVAMNYVLTGRTGSERSSEWLQYFDAVITGCGKPAFFSDSKPLFEVNTRDGTLRNTDGGNPMVPIGEADFPALEYTSSAPAGLEGGTRARVFQGGRYVDLHKMLGVKSGSEVLYVGDHIYGDILRSKKTLGWRTMLVVPELETELELLAQAGCRDTLTELRAIRQQRNALDDQIQRLEWRAEVSSKQSTSDSDEEEEGQYAEILENLIRQRDEVREQHRSLLQAHHEKFHRVWGQLLKTGYQNSRFAHQLERFACLYTSHVSNLSFYSPHKTYRARTNMMAHEEQPVFQT